MILNLVRKWQAFSKVGCSIWYAQCWVELLIKTEGDQDPMIRFALLVLLSWQHATRDHYLLLTIQIE